MNSFLFGWNPQRSTFDLEENITLLHAGNRVVEEWPCASHKKVENGDRAILVKLGKKPTGIIGSGFVASAPFLAPDQKVKEKLVPKVLIEFETLLDSNKEPILTLDILRQGKLSQQHWTPELPGISIKTEIVNEFEAMWFEFLSTQIIRYNPFLTEADVKHRVFNEGTPYQVIQTKYERNPHARNECIKHFGFDCFICGFNFEEKYGLTGKDFIHVHHLKQISEVSKPYEIHPIEDLRPICPNCHSLIHKRRPAYTIEEMKKFIKNK